MTTSESSHLISIIFFERKFQLMMSASDDNSLSLNQDTNQPSRILGAMVTPQV